MQFQPADPFSLTAFIVLCFIVAGTIYVGFQKANVPSKFWGFFSTYVFILTIFASSGFTADHVIPVAPLIILSLLVVAVGFAISNNGWKIAQAFDFRALVLFQVFRLPLEFILHQWASLGTVPPTMTWTGQNLDVVTGVLSLMIAPFANKSKAAVWLFEIVGSLLLLNVLRVVVMSSPFPFAWPLEQPLQLIFHSPYVLIAPICVAPAISGHIILLRKLIKQK